jgi:hypothetical protein
MTALSMVLLASGLVPGSLQPASDETVLGVRLYADAGVETGTRQRALEEAERLLTTAGVPAVWRDCALTASCDPEAGGLPEVVVILSSARRPHAREECGTAALDLALARGTVVVWVPCIADVASRLARRSEARAHPLLAAGRYDDLVGAVVAHEIAHVLGVRHRDRGLMRSRLEAPDVLALRTGLLAFSKEDAAAMRAATLLARAQSGSEAMAMRRDGGRLSGPPCACALRTSR